MHARFKVSHRVASLLANPRSLDAGNLLNIADAKAKLGLADDSAEWALLRAAAPPDGSISARAVDAYLREPKNLAVLTSSALGSVRTQVESAGGVPTGALKQAWQRELARRADLTHGEHDGTASAGEVDALFSDVKAGRVRGVQWMPDQRASVLLWRIGLLTGEKSALLNLGTTGTQLPKRYMQIVHDDKGHLPRLVGYTLSAADIRETPADVHRKDNFRQDPADRCVSSRMRQWS